MIIPDYKVKNLLLKKQVKISPYFDEFQGPNCYYCHLGDTFMIPKKGKEHIDIIQVKNSKKYFKTIKTNKSVKIDPGQFILAETFECFGVSDKYILKLLNSSSLARWGIGQAALGMINPGCGIKKPVKITLELFNTFPKPILLTPTIIKKNNDVVFGTECLKVVLEKIDSPPKKCYNNWEKAVYGNDYQVASSKMKGRFKKIINLKDRIDN